MYKGRYQKSNEYKKRMSKPDPKRQKLKSDKALSKVKTAVKVTFIIVSIIGVITGVISLIMQLY